MATLNKFNYFVADIANGIHNLASNQLTLALCASAHAPVATNHVLADLTEVAYTNLGSRNLTVASSVQTSGTYNLVINDLTIAATGNVATFRYVVVYNNTATNDNLIGWYDYGSDVSMVNGDSLSIDFDNTNGILSIT